MGSQTVPVGKGSGLQNMQRKVIIDCDPGIDDAIALMIAMLEPQLDVVAVTATEGNA
ncbi:MAG TPA: nucleoside hydrolase, partial [Pirellulaceae bacterium]